MYNSERDFISSTISTTETRSFACPKPYIKIEKLRKMPTKNPAKPPIEFLIEAITKFV
jgi:hypothetical protein